MNIRKLETFKINLLKDSRYSSVRTINHLFLSNEEFKTNKNYFFSDKYKRIIKLKLNTILKPKSIDQIVNNEINILTDIDENMFYQLIFFYLDLFNEDINYFLSKKEKYESLLLEKKYSEALSLINEIEENCCVSLWSTQQKFTLFELIEGLEKNKLFLDEKNSEVSDKAYLSILFNYFSLMAEEKTSYENYQKTIDKFFEDTKNNGVLEYLKYKLDLEYQINENFFYYIIQLESYSSIIDLYLSFIDLFPQVIFEEGNFDVQYLKNFKDNRLRNFEIQICKSQERLNYLLNEHIGAEYGDLVDSYSIGLYSDVIKNCTNNKIDYLDFQTMTLYIKSCIQSGYEELDCNIELYNLVFDIYSLNDKYTKSKLRLYQYVKILKGTTLEYKVRSFLNRHENSTDINRKIEFNSYLNDSYITPNFEQIILDKDIKEYFRIEIKKFYPKTSDIILQKNTLSIIDEFRKDYIDLEVDKLINYILESDYSMFSKERASVKVINTLYESGDIHKMIQFVVSAYFVNPLLIYRVDLKSIFKTTKRKFSKTTKTSIEYPIFVYLCDRSDAVKVRIANSNFFDFNDIKSEEEISDLLNLDKEERFKIYYLYEILTIYAIKNEARLVKNKNITAEMIRVQILEYLITLNISGKKIYQDEINEINKKEELHKRVSNINESKISVEIDKIYNENKNFWAEDLVNYQSTKEFGKKIYNNSIEDFKGLTEGELLSKKFNSINNEMRESKIYKQEILLLKSLIIKVITELLNNTNYGLETYLSSRIRHGYTKNHLSSVFNEFNLLLKTLDDDDNNTVYINDYWDSKKNTSKINYNLFKESLNRFTISIEQKINTVTQEWIRIKSSSSDIGMFDFTGLEDYILLNIVEMENITIFEFYECVVELFWIDLGNSLEHLRNEIEQDLKKFFYDSLDELQTDINDLDKRGIESIVSECNYAINSCKSKVELTVNEFSEVFKKPNISHDDFIMEELVETALSISEKIQKDFSKINLKKKITVKEKFKGAYFPHFIDMLSILINNALEHCGFSDISNLNIEISINKVKGVEEKLLDLSNSDLQKDDLIIDENTEYIEIKVTNNLSDEINIHEIRENLNNVLKHNKPLADIKRYVQSEGGTGFYKLKKILSYNIRCYSYIYCDVENELFNAQIIINPNQPSKILVS